MWNERRDFRLEHCFGLSYFCGHCAVLLYLDISRFSVVQEVKVLGHLRSG